MKQRILIDLFGLTGLSALTGGLYLKYGTADAAIVAGSLLIVFSAIAGMRRKA